MGLIISTILATGSLVAVGVLSSISASHTSECKKNKKSYYYNIGIAGGSFLIAIICFIIAILFI